MKNAELFTETQEIKAHQQAEKIAELLEADNFFKLRDKIMTSQRLMACYRCAILEVETKFKVLNEQLSLLHERNPIESITSRLKSPESIYEKIHRKDLNMSLENIEENLFDVAGVRVVCSFVDDIYMLADCLLSQDDIRLIKRKDYIKNPKPNGYRSLHLIIEVPIFLTDEKKMMKVEVQLRTVAMELWASIEHKIYYKKDIDEKTAEIAAERLLRCAEMSAELDKEMQSIRNFIDNN